SFTEDAFNEILLLDNIDIEILSAIEVRTQIAVSIFAFILLRVRHELAKVKLGVQAVILVVAAIPVLVLVLVFRAVHKLSKVEATFGKAHEAIEMAALVGNTTVVAIRMLRVLNGNR